MLPLIIHSGTDKATKPVKTLASCQR